MIKIGGLQETTLIDFPGRIAATVFVKGCNFRCPWCYSSELVLPEKAAKHPEISEKKFFQFLKSRQNLLDGVVVCGGEPTVSEGLADFIKKIKQLGFLVKLDTNGSNPEVLKKIIGQKLVDYLAMDIKAPLSGRQKKKYDRLTGIKADLKKMRKSVEIIKNSGLDYEFRTTVVPGLLTREDILQIARDISPAKKYFLQNFRPEKNLNPEAGRLKPYSSEYLLGIQKTIAPFFETCYVR